MKCLPQLDRTMVYNFIQSMYNKNKSCRVHNMMRKKYPVAHNLSLSTRGFVEALTRKELNDFFRDISNL